MNLTKTEEKILKYLIQNSFINDFSQRIVDCKAIDEIENKFKKSETESVEILQKMIELGYAQQMNDGYAPLIITLKGKEYFAIKSNNKKKFAKTEESILLQPL